MIIGIGGEPATGKSTLMRTLLKSFSPGISFKDGLVKGTVHSYRDILSVAVVGTYDDPHFPGTDRLSMGAQPKVLEWLYSKGRPSVVLFEGDRLFTGSFIYACQARPEPCRFLLLQAPSSLLENRHAERGDTQSATFKKGRATKYKNLAALPSITIHQNATPEDTEWICRSIIKSIDETLPQSNMSTT